MSKHTTLFVTVGRAAPRPLCTSTDEATLTGAEYQERLSLLNGGCSADRIQFSREDTVIEDKPKGKGR